MEETVSGTFPTPTYRLQSERSSHESLLDSKAAQVLTLGDTILYLKST